MRMLLLFLLAMVPRGAEAQCNLAARGGRPCPPPQPITLDQYMAAVNSGTLPAVAHSYAEEMDETAWLQQQTAHDDGHDHVTAAPTHAPAPPTPGPTPGGVQYFKDCTHVTCEYVDDHHVTVYHSHLEKHGPYHRSAHARRNLPDCREPPGFCNHVDCCFSVYRFDSFITTCTGAPVQGSLYT